MGLASIVDAAIRIAEKSVGDLKILAVYNRNSSTYDFDEATRVKSVTEYPVSLIISNLEEEDLKNYPLDSSMVKLTLFTALEFTPDTDDTVLISGTLYRVMGHKAIDPLSKYFELVCSSSGAVA